MYTPGEAIELLQKQIKEEKERKKMSGHWEGQCIKCVHCCLYDVQWVMFNGEVEKLEAIEWADARGYKIIQITDLCLHAEFYNPCPQLQKDNKECRLQDNKPVWCKKYPKMMMPSRGFDVNKLSPTCGFKWVEDE